MYGLHGIAVLSDCGSFPTFTQLHRIGARVHLLMPSTHAPSDAHTTFFLSWHLKPIYEVEQCFCLGFYNSDKDTKSEINPKRN